MNYPSVKKLSKELEVFYSEDDYGIFARKRIKKRFNQVISDESPLGITFNILQSLTDWTLDDTFHYLIHKKDLSQATEAFKQSTAYGYLYTKNVDDVWGYWG